MSDYALVTAPQCITGEEFLFKCQIATFSPDGFYRWMEKVWQLEDFFFVESFLLLLKPFCFNGNILCSVILLKKQKVFQLQAGFMYVVSCHRRSLKREDTSRIWWSKGEELHLGFPQSLWLLWDIGVPLCVYAWLTRQCAPVSSFVPDQNDKSFVFLRNHNTAET